MSDKVFQPEDDRIRIIRFNSLVEADRNRNDQNGQWLRAGLVRPSQQVVSNAVGGTGEPESMEVEGDEENIVDREGDEADTPKGSLLKSGFAGNQSIGGGIMA